jgi:hypothetical protein
MPTVSSHGQDNLTVRKIYGQDRIRLLRCRTCGEEFSERRGTALSTLVAATHLLAVLGRGQQMPLGSDVLGDGEPYAERKRWA